MPGANAVLKRHLSRTRPYPKGKTGRRTATGSNDGVALATHLSSGGATGISQFPNSKDQGRSYQTFGKSN
jgi:hypothetical protein